MLIGRFIHPSRTISIGIALHRLAGFENSDFTFSSENKTYMKFLIKFLKYIVKIMHPFYKNISGFCDYVIMLNKLQNASFCR